MAAKQREKIQSTGFGDSQPNIAPPGSFEDTLNWDLLTVNGYAIPEDARHLFTYEMTDQGRAERDALRQEPRVQVLSEPGDPNREAAKFRTDIIELPPEEAHDPFRDIIARNTPAGHRGMMMSKTKCDREGMRRGRVDYQPVLGPDGKMITLGSMFLGSAPAPIVEASTRYYENLGREMAAQSADKVRAANEEVYGEAKLKRMDRQKHGGLEFDGLQSEDGGMVASELGLDHEFDG